MTFSRRKIYGIIAIAFVAVAAYVFVVYALKRADENRGYTFVPFDAWRYSPPSTDALYALMFDKDQLHDFNGKKKAFDFVTPGMVPSANQRLEKVRFQSLTLAEARQLSGKPLKTLPAGNRYYLLRAFQGPTVFASKGYIWVSCGMMTHSNYVKMDRNPIIVAASQSPRDVFLTFSVAE